MTSKQNHLLILCITGYLAMAGGALLAPALPEMILPLRIPAQAAGLLMSVFTMSTAIFTLVLGHFIDQVDRKKILVPGLVLYGLAGVVSFFITYFSVLLAVRFVQGIGVASMMTLAFLIVGDIFPGHESMGLLGKWGCLWRQVPYRPRLSEDSLLDWPGTIHSFSMHYPCPLPSL